LRARATGRLECRGAGEDDTYGPPTAGGGGRERDVTDDAQVAAGTTVMAWLTGTKGTSQIDVAAQEGVESDKTLVTPVAKIK
jgi:hypothetical protein